MKGPEKKANSRKYNELLKLALAMRCFRGAFEMCQHVVELKLAEDDFLYGPCMAGVVVTYARPFSPAKEIGVHPRRFSQFENATLQAAHRELILLRNKVYGHQDASDLGAFEIRNPKGLQVYATTLELGIDTDGVHYIRPDANVPQVTADSVPAYIELLRFQMHRIEKATDPLIKSMAGDKLYKLGRYQVGLNFP